jgi:hypothetical protein
LFKLDPNQYYFPVDFGPNGNEQGTDPMEPSRSNKRLADTRNQHRSEQDVAFDESPPSNPAQIDLATTRV